MTGRIVLFGVIFLGFGSPSRHCRNYPNKRLQWLFLTRLHGLLIILRRIRFLERSQSLIFMAFGCMQKIFSRRAWIFISGKHGRSLRITGLVLGFVLFTNLFVSFETLNNPVVFPLWPGEIVLVPRFVITQRPPKSRLQSLPNNLWIIAFAYIVFVGNEGLNGEIFVQPVRFVNLHQKKPVVPLSQLKILVLVLGIC